MNFHGSNNSTARKPCVWNVNESVLKLTDVGRCGGERKDVVSLSHACQACLGRFYSMTPAC